MSAVFLDLDSVHPQDLDFSALDRACPGWVRHPYTDSAQRRARVAGAEIIISNKVVVDAGVMDAAPDLRLICVAATGTNNVDLAAARARGIAVCNVVAYGTPSVAQHVFAMLLSLVTHLGQHATAARDGRWADSRFFCWFGDTVTELAGKTFAVLGYGELGRGAARIARGFDMEVLIGARPGTEPVDGRLPLHELLARADVLSLHLPLTDTTHNLIDARALALMKPSAILINTARGGIVDEAALADALRRGRLGGAGVDTLALEPPDGSSPLLADDIPNLIVTPHVAWSSREARQRLLGQLVGNIEAFRSGEARNRVA